MGSADTTPTGSSSVGVHRQTPASETVRKVTAVMQVERVGVERRHLEHWSRRDSGYQYPCTIPDIMEEGSPLIHLHAVQSLLQVGPCSYLAFFMALFIDTRQVKSTERHTL